MATKRSSLKRLYSLYYNKLAKYGQIDTAPLSHPWQRDVDRLKRKWATLKKYATTYYQLKTSIEEFNSDFLENIEVPEPSGNINQASLKTLQERLKKFRNKRRLVKKRVATEEVLIERNLEDLIKTAFDYASPSRHTAAGEMTPHQQHVYRQATRLREFIKDVIPEEQPARRIKLSQIKRDWELLRRACEVFFYDSDQARVAEAWAQINFILTGRGSGEDEIYDLWED